MKYVICDTQLDWVDGSVGPTNPCQVRWFDKFANPSGLPHWVGSCWYAQLQPTEEAAEAIIAQLEALGQEGFIVSLDALEP